MNDWGGQTAHPVGFAWALAFRSFSRNSIRSCAGLSSRLSPSRIADRARGADDNTILIFDSDIDSR